MKKLSKVLLSTLLMGSLLLAGCGGNKDQQQAANNDKQTGTPQEEKTVYIVGTNPAFAPFEYQDEDGNITGFDIDLVKAIGADQGFEIEIKSMEFDALTQEIQNGTIDIIASGMSITKERLKVVDFSEPYVQASLAIAVRADNEDINGPDDLAGKVVAAQIGTTGADQCFALEEEGKVKEVKVLQDYDLCMLELINGSVDAVINDVPVTRAYIDKNPDAIKMTGEAIVSDSYGLAIRKGNSELKAMLDTGLANIKADGTFDKLYAEYKIADEMGAGEETPADDAANDDGEMPNAE